MTTLASGTSTTPDNLILWLIISPLDDGGWKEAFWAHPENYRPYELGQAHRTQPLVVTGPRDLWLGLAIEDRPQPELVASYVPPLENATPPQIRPVDTRFNTYKIITPGPDRMAGYLVRLFRNPHDARWNLSDLKAKAAQRDAEAEAERKRWAELSHGRNCLG